VSNREKSMTHAPPNATSMNFANAVEVTENAAVDTTATTAVA